MIGAFACLAAALVSIGEAAPPQTEELALTLSWQAPAGCPDLVRERAEIRRRLGGADRPASPPIVASGQIRHEASAGYVLSLRTVVGATTGERVLSGQDCQQLAEAAALILAMLVNPEAAEEPPSPPALPPDPPPPPPALRPEHGVGVDALLATGVLPRLAEGLALRLFYGKGPIMVAAQIAGFLPQKVVAPLWPGATASFTRLDSVLAVCATTPFGRRLAARLCLGGSVARLQGRSAGIAAPGEATGYWFEAVAEPSLYWQVAPSLRLRLAGDLRGLGARPTLAIAGLGSVYRPAAINFRGALGAELFF